MHHPPPYRPAYHHPRPRSRRAWRGGDPERLGGRPLTDAIADLFADRGVARALVGIVTKQNGGPGRPGHRRHQPAKMDAA